MKLVFALLISALAFSGCNEKENVSGDMTYHKMFEVTAYEAFITSGSECAALLDAVQRGTAALSQKYNKEWVVPFSGPSADSALAKADKEAVADFDAAVESLLKWQKEFDDFKVTKDFGRGSFSVTYVIRVWRDKVLKVSEPIGFEYEYKK